MNPALTQCKQCQTSGLSAPLFGFSISQTKAHPSSRVLLQLSPAVTTTLDQEKKTKKKHCETRALAEVPAAAVYFHQARLNVGKERKVQRIVVHIDVADVPAEEY